MKSMQPRTLAALRRGVEAGLVASVPQVLGTHLEERLLDLPEGSANIGPRFMQQLAKITRQRLSQDVKWLGAASFHFGYSAWWGAIYAVAYEKRPVHPAVGGLALSGLIYALTFPNWGMATRTRTERPPRRRSWRRKVFLFAPPLIFGMGTALLYGRGPRRGEVVLAEEILRDPLRRNEEARTATMPRGAIRPTPATTPPAMRPER